MPGYHNKEYAKGTKLNPGLEALLKEKPELAERFGVDKKENTMGSNLNREEYGRKLAEYGRKMMMQGMRLVKENGMGSKLYQNGTGDADGTIDLPEDAKIEFITRGGTDGQGYFLVGGQVPMDQAQVREYLQSQGYGPDTAREEANRMRSEGSRYALPAGSMPGISPMSPYTTKESKAMAGQLKNKARQARAVGNIREAEALEELIPGMMGNPGVDFRKTVAPGAMAKKPTISPFLEGLERMRGGQGR
jgi:hypothetical protein